MRHLIRTLIAATLAGLWSPLVAQPSPAARLFHEALMLERAEGKIQEAIFRLERVIAEFPADKDVLPQAIHHLALAYEKRNDPRAIVLLTRLVTDFPTASPYAADARRKLAVSQAAVSGPFKTAVLDPNFEFGSPDGRFVVYYKRPESGTKLYVRDLAARTERVLLDGDYIPSNFSFSPDSRYLAFNANNQMQKLSDVRIVTMATGEVRDLGVRGYPRGWTTQDELFIYRPNYSESNSVDWFLLSVSGGEPRKVYVENTSDGCCTAIVPTGKTLIVARSKRLMVRDLATGSERPLTTGSGEESRPIVSPDGRLVVFLSNQEGKWAANVAPIETAPTASPVRLGPVENVGLQGGGGAQWSTRDGVVTLRFDLRESDVYRLAIDPLTGRGVGAPERLTQDAPENFNPAVSPDGKRIAYYFRSGLRQGIAVMDANGLNERPLIEMGGVLPIAWRSPDEILFKDFATPTGRRAFIRTLNIKTGLTQDVASVEGLYWAYAPARREILHLYPGGGGGRPGAVLKAYSIPDGKDRVVATIDYLLPQLTVSPDGRHIAYTVLTSGSTMTSPRCDVAMMTTDGGFEQTLLAGQLQCPVQAVSWSPSGRHLLLSTGQGATVLDVETKQFWPVPAEGMDQPLWGGHSWSPDGSFVTLTRSTRRIDRLTWEGVTHEAVTKLMASGK